MSDITKVIIDTIASSASKTLIPFDWSSFTSNLNYSNINIIWNSEESNAIVLIKIINSVTWEYIQLNSIQTDNDWNWRYDGADITNLPDWVNTINVSIIDIAWNIYENPIPTYITKWTEFEIPVTITNFSEDTWNIWDKVTNDNTLLISWTSLYSNAVVKIFSNEIYIGDAYTDSEWNWEFDNSSNILSNWKYIFRTEIISNWNNIWTSLPFKITINSWTNNFSIELVDSNSDSIINSLNPVFTGTCTPNNMVTIKDNNYNILSSFTCTATWEYQVTSQELSYWINWILATEKDNVWNIIDLPELKILILKDLVYADIQEATSQVPEFTWNCNNSWIIIREGNNIIDYVTDETKVKNFDLGYYVPWAEYWNGAYWTLNNKINLYIDWNNVSEWYCINNKVNIKYDSIVNWKHTAYVTQSNIFDNESSKSTEVNFRADKWLILPNPKLYNEKENKLYYDEFSLNLIDGNFSYTPNEIDSLLNDLFWDADIIFTSKDTSPSYLINCNTDWSVIRVFVDWIPSDETFNCSFPDWHSDDFYKMVITTPYLANWIHRISYTETTGNWLTAQSSEVLVDIAWVRADVNGDWGINSIDLALLERRIAQLDMWTTAWIDSHIGWDVNCDWVTNSVDMSLMQRKVTQLDMSNTSWCE